MSNFTLTRQQKEEIRRLTQKANRRIKTAHKEYSKAGLTIAPKEVVGDFQTKYDWETKGAPLSRSVQFGSKKEYNERMKFLRSFDREPSRGGKLTMTEYTELQRFKVLKAVETSVGGLPADQLHDIMDKLDTMSAPDVAEFWQRFSEKSSRKGLQYSSDAVMVETISEFFDEDIRDLM